MADIEGALLIIVQAIFAMLPAYVANPMAVLTGGGAPMDGGRVWRDGRRVLGDGKTWRGLVGGTAGGMVFCGILSIMVRASHNRSLTDFNMPGWGAHSWVYVGFLLAFGALFGDFVKSFFKRRLGFGRGSKAPIMDMYDHVLGAFLFAGVLAWPWFEGAFHLWAPWHVLVVVLVTPLLHRSVNIIGYKMGKKSVPW